MSDSSPEQDGPSPTPCYSFEEFRMMYDSTELVSDRKINFTRYNASLCLAVIAGQGVGASWAYEKPGLEWMAPLAILIISILGIVFCMYWNGQLWAFKDLNEAKFKVLEEMASYVAFPDYKERSIRSMSPFYREYEILKEKKKLKESRSGLMLKSNFAETVVPKTFMLFFAMVAVFCLAWLLLNIGLIRPFE